jgi:hypothetical protein
MSLAQKPGPCHLPNLLISGAQNQHLEVAHKHMFMGIKSRENRQAAPYAAKQAIGVREEKLTSVSGPGGRRFK